MIELEHEKLELEVAQLKKAFYRRPTFWLSAIGTAIAVWSFVHERQLSADRLILAELKEERTLKRAEASLKKAEEAEEELERTRNRTNEVLEERKSAEANLERLTLQYTALEADLKEKQKAVNSLIGSSADVERVAELRATTERRNRELAVSQTRALTTVLYYKKGADGDRVLDALEGARSQGLSLPPVILTSNPFYDERALASNAVLCGTKTPIEVVRNVATTLLSRGIRLQYVGGFFGGERNTHGIWSRLEVRGGLGGKN